MPLALCLGDQCDEMETEATRTPDDEHLARLLAAVIVADLRRFPPVDSWDIIGVEVKSRPPEPAA